MSIRVQPTKFIPLREMPEEKERKQSSIPTVPRNSFGPASTSASITPDLAFIFRTVDLGAAKTQQEAEALAIEMLDFETSPDFVQLTDGRTYAGPLNEENRAHGYGAITYPSSDKEGRFLYVGEFVNGVLCGEGTLIWKDGRKHTGHFAKNKPHGEGKRTYPAVDSRGLLSEEGSWKEGVLLGRVTIKYADTATIKNKTYVGLWNGDTPEGQGEMAWTYLNRSCKMTGEFLNWDLYTGNLVVGPAKEGERATTERYVEGVKQKCSCSCVIL